MTHSVRGSANPSGASKRGWICRIAIGLPILLSVWYVATFGAYMWLRGRDWLPTIATEPCAVIFSPLLTKPPRALRFPGSTIPYRIGKWCQKQGTEAYREEAAAKRAKDAWEVETTVAD